MTKEEERKNSREQVSNVTVSRCARIAGAAERGQGSCAGITGGSQGVGENKVVVPRRGDTYKDRFSHTSRYIIIPFSFTHAL